MSRDDYCWSGTVAGRLCRNRRWWATNAEIETNPNWHCHVHR